MGFMESLFGGPTVMKTQIKPATKDEKVVAGNISKASTASYPLFQQLLAQQLGQTGYNDQLYNQMFGQQLGYNNAFSPEEQGQQQADWMRSVQGLGLQDQDIINMAMGQAGAGTGATPEQIRLIQQATDLATQSGLSDLAKFRDDSFQGIRTASAGRGLRPMDTPILNQLGRSGEEFDRQAQQFVTGLRTNQAQQQLAYPLAAGSFGIQQMTTASDMANRRAAFQAQLANNAQANQLNFGSGLTANGLGMAQNFSGAGQLGALVGQRQYAPGQVTQTGGPGFLSPQAIGGAAASFIG